MIGGTVSRVTLLSDRVRLTVQGTGHDANVYLLRDVYPTPAAKAVRPGDSVWWDSNVVYWTGISDEVKDILLVRIRQNDGAPSPWPVKDAARMAGVKVVV